METATPARSRRARRIVTGIAAILVLAIVGSYAVTRALSAWRALRIVTASGAASLPARDDAGETLRIACYNIAHGRGSGDANFNGESAETRDRRLTDIAEFLKAADLDVAMLCEVDFDSAWSGGVNQAEVIAARGGFPYHTEQRNFDAGVPFFHVRFGNAILSRHPIVEAHRVDLPGDAAWETILAGKKTGSVATIEFPYGKQVRLFAVHLSYRSEAVRIASAQAIREEAKRSLVPMIVAGDFNSTPVSFPEADPSGESALDDLLRDGRWKTLPTEPPQPSDFTFSSTNPDRVIDWILAPPQWQLLSRQVYPVEFSDHRPVVGIVRNPTRPDVSD